MLIQYTSGVKGQSTDEKPGFSLNALVGTDVSDWTEVKQFLDQATS